MLKRSEEWVQKHWRKKPSECFTDFSNHGRPVSLSQESNDIINSGKGMQVKSCRALASEIFSKREKEHSKDAVQRFLKKKGL